MDNKIREFLKNGKEIDGVLTSICGLGIIAAREMLDMGLTELFDNLIIFDDRIRPFDRSIEISAEIHPTGCLSDRVYGSGNFD